MSNAITMSNPITPPRVADPALFARRWRLDEGGLALALVLGMFSRKVFLILPCVAALVFVGCSATPPEEDEDETSDALSSGSCAGTSTGPCAGQPIDTAVKCAQALGARVLSYYRSPAQQECVRRQNGCTNRCTGSAGCARPTAGCTSSPHTKCLAVDLVANGAPLTQSQLRSCGLAKTTAPHVNHYDYVGGGTTTVDPDEPDAPAGCASATLRRTVPPGTCVQRPDDDVWYVCDADNLGAWPSIEGPSDPQCTSCPQLAGGRCP
jgi:hypothetical protein